MRTILNSTVCVVGGAGFLGSHLVNHLIQDRGCKVLVVDNLVVGRREFIPPEATFVHHDITDSEDYLTQVLVDNDVDFVFNYAAYPYIPVSFARPLHVANVNCFGALKVINAAQTAGAKAILQVSSAEVYGHAGGSEKEMDLLGCKINELYNVTPHSSYGASKAAIDYLCQVSWRERNTPVIALRQFNCVGERETHPYVVPEIISQLAVQRGMTRDSVGLPDFWKADPAIVKLGNNSFRDFMYAGDQARIATELLERGQFGEVYNLGSESGIKIYDLAKLIGKVMHFEKVEVQPDPARVRPWEIWHLQSDNSKIWSVLMSGSLSSGIVVQRREDGVARVLVTLEEALRRTVAWYEQNDRRWPWEK